MGLPLSFDNYSQSVQHRPLSHPHPLADADITKWPARQGELAREKDRVRGDPLDRYALFLAVLALLLACVAPCHAELSPNQLKDVALNPSPGAALPAAAEFTSGGARLSFGDALAGKPSVLILVDYRCHFTCGTALGIAADGLAQSGLEAGRDYNLVVIGIDPASTPADAEAMKAANLAPYPALLASAKFLNGDAAAIASVTGALGYKPVYDAARGEFAHPLGVVILTGEGRVSRVIQGLSLGPDRLKAALLDGQQGILSALVEGIRLLCYGHNPLQGANTATVQTVLKGGALLTLPALAARLCSWHAAPFHCGVYAERVKAQSPPHPQPLSREGRGESGCAR